MFDARTKARAAVQKRDRRSPVQIENPMCFRGQFTLGDPFSHNFKHGLVGQLHDAGRFPQSLDLHGSLYLPDPVKNVTGRHQASMWQLFSKPFEGTNRGEIFVKTNSPLMRAQLRNFFCDLGFDRFSPGNITLLVDRSAGKLAE